MERIRINKYLSEKGAASRREADRLIEEGRITVNGLRAVKGQPVCDEDDVRIDGKKVSKATPDRVILAVHKPVGVVCTTRTFPGEENIVDMVGYPERLYPVGRLDKDSSGLIFLTNDGGFAAEITKASGRHEKEYIVEVDKPVTDALIKRLEKGVYLKDLDKTTAACRARRIDDKKLRIVLTQGLNRQIRRMCETCGFKVLALKRVRIMNVKLGDLRERAYRKIEGAELAALLKGDRNG